MATQGLFHFMAYCHDCPARCEARNAQAWAHNHANKHRHAVSLDLGWRIEPDAAPPKEG